MELLIQIKLGERMADKAKVTVLQQGFQLETSDIFIEVIFKTQSKHSIKFQALILNI
jgi:hypothetical protein